MNHRSALKTFALDGRPLVEHRVGMDAGAPKTSFPRVTQTLAVLLPAGALIATSVIIWVLSIVFKAFFNDLLGEKPLPSLTSAFLAFGPHVPLLGCAAAVICLVAAFLLARNAASIEAASHRLLILVSIVWLFCLVALSISSVSFALPLFSIDMKMTDSATR